jgi:hypothetical protein
MLTATALRQGRPYPRTGITAKKSLQLGRAVEWPDSPEKAVLDRVPNPQAGTDYLVRFTAPEFISRLHRDDRRIRDVKMKLWTIIDAFAIRAALPIAFTMWCETVGCRNSSIRQRAAQWYERLSFDPHQKRLVPCGVCVCFLIGVPLATAPECNARIGLGNALASGHTRPDLKFSPASWASFQSRMRSLAFAISITIRRRESWQSVQSTSFHLPPVI